MRVRYRREPRSPNRRRPSQKIVQDAMKTEHLRAAIVKMTRATGRDSQAFGESSRWCPTTACIFAMAPSRSLTSARCSCCSSRSTRPRPTTRSTAGCRTLPESDKVTLKMLTNQTSGYPDFETDPNWNVGVQRRSVPHLDLSTGGSSTCSPPRPVRSRHKLELLAH